MILKTDNATNLVKSTGLETSVVEVCTSPESVKILTENLYSDVPLAIVRELSTNAIDANRDAGNRLNDFIIHIPSQKEPYFSIEDHGTGMSKEKVMHVFKDFFKSTRDKDNKHAGMYGLGAKTPLAYTRNFTIVSSFNGESNTYVEVWENDKLPEISLVPNTTKKSSVSGTKITIPVKVDDIYAFNQAIIKACAFFPGLPTFENLDKDQTFKYSDYVSPYRDCVMTIGLLDKINQGFKKTDFNRHDYFYDKVDVFTSKLYVEMGNVGYPIDETELFNPDSNFGKFYYELKKHFSTIIIHANIGDVDVLPSREGLKLSKKTTSYLKSWFISFIADKYEISNDINTRIKNYATNEFIKMIDYIYENLDLIFENKKDAFIKFYNLYQNDREVIAKIFHDNNSILTYVLKGEIDCKNGLLPYPYIDNLADEYIPNAKYNLRVIVNTPEVKKHLKSTTLRNLSGTYIRSHIMGLPNYKEYIYLFTSPLTLKAFDEHGILYSEIRDFTEIKTKPNDAWADKDVFEVQYKIKNQDAITVAKLWSWNNVKRFAVDNNLHVYFLIKTRKGQFCPCSIRVSKDTETIFVGSRFDYACNDIVSDPLTDTKKDCIIVSSGISNITKASENSENLLVKSFVDDIKHVICSTLEEIKSLPKIESNNLIKIIRETCGDYVKSYAWPENSVFKKLFDTFQYGDKNDKRRSDKLDWLEFGIGQDYLRMFLRLPSKGNEELIKLYKETFVNRSSLADKLKSYPLIGLKLLNGYQDEYGFIQRGSSENYTKYIKFLVDYFAKEDGAKPKSSTN